MFNLRRKGVTFMDENNNTNQENGFVLQDAPTAQTEQQSTIQPETQAEQQQTTQTEAQTEPESRFGAQPGHFERLILIILR